MKTSVYVFCLVLFSHFVISSGTENEYQEKCPSSFNCGNLGMIEFPFTTTKRLDCGLLAINGCDNHSTIPTVKWNDTIFAVFRVGHSSVIVRDLILHGLLESKKCEAFSKNFTLPPDSPLASFHAPFNVTLFRCNRTLNVSPPASFFKYSYCPDYDIYYGLANNENAKSSLSACLITRLPSKDFADTLDPFTLISSEIFLQIQLSDACDKYYSRRKGRCQLDSNSNFHCGEEKRSWKLGLGLGLGTGVFVTLVIGILIIWICKRKSASSTIPFHSRDSSYSNSDPETGSAYFGIPVFSYKELEEATNNFDSARELGDGGFGTVYYGKLQDGREVAVKRLYEHNYRRVEQFMNEVKILTRLRHQNLVSLFGCTSRQSQDLLLVYEYIPNGTIASHLHGDLAKPGLLPWAVRMKIAIETATALAYLHATDIVHRDVKTNNILLDNSYCVKVADFGLSRLFPNDVTHVSTAPQGTPGYVDPEYHQCYQLTSKSDVYSFGVVLIELISSKPAVDMSRHRDEINLSNLAIKKIQKSAFSELVDPYLGFESDNEVKRMIISVAELAFQCLQSEKEQRPSMDEILQALKMIERGEDEPKQLEEEDIHGAGIAHSNSVQPPPSSSPDWDEVELLKSMKLPPSPNTVADKWESKSTTPNFSV